MSIASLLVGVAAANASRGTVITAGAAGLVAGAMSLAVGEYVSVSSQRDAERGDLAKETAEAFIAASPAASQGVDGHERRCVVRSSCVRAARPSCSMRSISERAHPTSRAAAMPYGGSSA